MKQLLKTHGSVNGRKQMLKSRERFYSSNGKRLQLVVGDEAVNREFLRFILEIVLTSEKDAEIKEKSSA